MVKKSGIYIITCVANRKVYVGSSVNINSRFSRHRADLKHGVHQNKHMQNAYNKYGVNFFVYKLIEECLPAQLQEREQFYINKYRSWEKSNGFNKFPNAYTPRGYKLSKITKQKISKAMKGHSCSEETRKKIGIKHKGKKISSHIIEASIKAQTGRVHSEESILKRARKYSFIGPDKKIYQGYNLKRFADKHKLHRSNLQKVLKGEQSHHKGFKKYKQVI